MAVLRTPLHRKASSGLRAETLRSDKAAQHSIKALSGLYYPTRHVKPIVSSIPTTIPRDADSAVELNDFPSFEAVLGLKYKTHDCWVVWKGHRGVTHRFLIGFQHRSDLPDNLALQSVHGIRIRGEVIVMQGKGSNSLMGIRSNRSRTLAREAARR